MKGYLNQLCAAFSAFLIMGSAAGCRDQASQAQSKNEIKGRKAVNVSIIEIKPVPIRDILVLPGETEAWQDVIMAADTAGQVEWIGPREGDPVREGELLAKIDVSSLKAGLDRAEAASKLAEDLYRRRKQLFDRRIIHQEELERALTEQTLAQGTLRQARIEYERGFPRAPIKGLVNHLYVDAGEFVKRGDSLMDLVNVDRIKVNVNVPELDVRYMRVGQEAKVTIDAFPGNELTGSIDFVSFKAAQETKTFLVRVLVENPKHTIRPGMIARVAFLRRVIPDALVAPLFSLVDKGGERILFVEKDGVAHARTVSTGVIEGDRVQIIQGLNKGDRLIVAGQTEVEEGTKVQIR